MTSTSLSTSPLHLHPKLLRVSVELAAVRRAFHGRQLHPLKAGNALLTVKFGEVAATHAQMQLRLRCGGHEVELQVADPTVLADVGMALKPGVPVALQRASVMHALQPLWHALEQRLDTSVELLALTGPVAAWPSSIALGMTIEKEVHGAARVERTQMMLKAHNDLTWEQLAQSGESWLPLSVMTPCDPPVALSARCPPIPLSLAELTALEAGDVLLLDASADRLEQMPVGLAIQAQFLEGCEAVFRSGRVEITQVPNTSMTDGNWPVTRRTAMNPPTTQNHRSSHGGDELAPSTTAAMGASASLDTVMVSVEVELGRLSMPLSALRSLAVGQVFDTTRAIDGRNVALWCGGHQLGVGQVVAVGDRLGVRIAALQPLNGTATPDASSPAEQAATPNSRAAPVNTPVKTD